MSFAEWELVLSSGNQQAADTVWNAIKDKAVKLQAAVISATSTSVQLAGSDDDIEAKKTDITLTMEKPIPARLMPQPGTMMAFQGTVASYTPNPFMMTMTGGILLDKNGNPVYDCGPRASSGTQEIAVVRAVPGLAYRSVRVVRFSAAVVAAKILVSSCPVHGPEGPHCPCKSNHLFRNRSRTDRTNEREQQRLPSFCWMVVSESRADHGKTYRPWAAPAAAILTSQLRNICCPA